MKRKPAYDPSVCLEDHLYLNSVSRTKILPAVKSARHRLPVRVLGNVQHFMNDFIIIPSRWKFRLSRAPCARSMTAARGVASRRSCPRYGSRKAELLPTGGRVLGRGRPHGVKQDWNIRTSDNGKGTVFQSPDSTGNANSLRIMNATPDYPNGYVRFYNDQGQSIGLDGKPGPNSETHIPRNTDGSYPTPNGW